MLDFNYKLLVSKILFLVLIGCGAVNVVFAQTKQPELSPETTNDTTEFTYQGRLVDNNLPANGTYDFQFRLTDGTNDPNLVIGTLLRTGVQVVNGIFTVRLDFGRSFPGGQPRFLEIGVKPVGTAAYMTLSPLQQITATPYAIHSADASFANVSNFAQNSQNATNAVNAENAVNSQNAVNATFANTANEATNATYASISIDSTKLGGVNADQYVLVVDSRLSDERNPLPNSPNYIQNTSNQQTANFNINGTGTATLFSALTVNSALQYSLGGAKFITAPTGGNTFLGLGVGTFLTTGVRNSFFGNNAGRTSADGSDNSFFGFEAGKLNSSGVSNSFFGANSGLNNTSGNYNSFFGNEAGLTNATGFYNSYFGYQAGKSATDANGNSFFGAQTGLNTTSGGTNAFFGTSAGYANTTGSQNAYFGAYAGRLGFEVTGNSFFGAYAGNNNGGSNNAFVGSSAGFNNGGSGNSFFGAESGYQNTNGGGNSFVGYRSGYANTTGYSNTFLGSGAGTATTSGFENVFIGTNAGAVNVTGSRNIFIGNNAGGEYGTTNGTDNIGIGNNTLFGQNVTNSVAIGTFAYTNSSNQIILGNTQQNTYVTGKLTIGLFAVGTSQLCVNGNNEVGRCSSSIRYKTDVEDFSGGIDVVRRLRPVTFKWKQSGERDLGFIAEEVNAVEPLMTVYNEKGEVEGVKYDRIATALVNAVNEQQTEIESQKTEIDTQKKQIEEQQTLIETQQKQLEAQQKQLDALMRVICRQNSAAEVCSEKK